MLIKIQPFSWEKIVSLSRSIIHIQNLWQFQPVRFPLEGWNARYANWIKIDKKEAVISDLDWRKTDGGCGRIRFWKLKRIEKKNKILDDFSLTSVRCNERSAILDNLVSKNNWKFVNFLFEKRIKGNSSGWEQVSNLVTIKPNWTFWLLRSRAFPIPGG